MRLAIRNQQKESLIHLLITFFCLKNIEDSLLSFISSSEKSLRNTTVHALCSIFHCISASRKFFCQVTWFFNNQRESNRPSPLPNGSSNNHEFNRTKVYIKKFIKVCLTPLMNSSATTVKAAIVMIHLLCCKF